ncbi:hypothetical protein [Moraxella pluranimalium]|uniref:Uncharacterized protein n=1 Tax=Moraxella pluranimalium TaxID=470453 RepID=A0A1T0CMM0_9GAMM|nr:hypothetical protein [Moraxella pluranimalium]OOS23565.1 hypothetical protein B0680_06290 [Moraxella pluranimalium]
MIDIATLPMAVQEQIANLQAPLAITQNGKLIATLNPTPSYTNGEFDYDLNRMKAMMDTEFKPMPDFENEEAFLAWVHS